MKEKPARKRARRHEWQYSRELQRIREIEKLIRHRHGSMIPDPVGTDDVDTCLAYLRAVALTPRTQDLVSWSQKWAPWVDQITLQTIAAAGTGRRWMIKADAVARLLSVTMADRTKLGLRTIGACDMSIEDRKKQAKASKRERDRNRQEQKRRAEGREDRASYEATSLTRLKPWEAAGMSRAAWYRTQRETGLSRIEINGNGDTLVSEPDLPPTPPRIQAGQSRAAGLVRGLGHHAPAGFQGAAPHGSDDARDEDAA